MMIGFDAISVYANKNVYRRTTVPDR